MWTAADAPDGNYSVPTVVIVLVVSAVIYLFGYLRAVMHRANKDYKAIKSAVKPAQKAFWGAWWAAVKIGFWVLVAFGIMFVWVWHDVGEKGDRPVPTASTSAKPSPSHRR